MDGSEFVFDGINSLSYDLNKISLNRGGSYIKSERWLEEKQATINPQNKNDNKYFQYALTIALNYEKINNNRYRISKKLKNFINQYNWEEIDFPSTGKDWKKFESSNESIALNILYVPHNTEKICHAYKSKYNLTRENQLILFMITDGEKWNYLAVTSLSGLRREITSNHNRDFYYLNYFHAYTTENKLESHKKVCENHEKSMKAPFIIFADLESLLEKMDTSRKTINN